MAKKSLISKNLKKQKFKVREYNRCSCCGRARGFLRMFGLCRICFRKFANFAQIPGVKKSSW